MLPPPRDPGALGGGEAGSTGHVFCARAWALGRHRLRAGSAIPAQGPTVMQCPQQSDAAGLS